MTTIEQKSTQNYWLKKNINTPTVNNILLENLEIKNEVVDNSSLSFFKKLNNEKPQQN